MAIGLEVNKIYKGETKSGKRFASKLVEIHGEALLFENSIGERFYHNIEGLASLTPVRTRQEE